MEVWLRLRWLEPVPVVVNFWVRRPALWCHLFREAFCCGKFVSLAAIHSFFVFGSPLWRICHRFTLLTEQEREVQFKHNINNNIEDRMLARARIERDRVTGTPHHDYSCHFLSTLDLKNFPLCKIGQNPLQNWKVGNLKTDLRSLGQNNFRKHADRNFLWLILSVVV